MVGIETIFMNKQFYNKPSCVYNMALNLADLI